MYTYVNLCHDQLKSKPGYFHWAMGNICRSIKKGQWRDVTRMHSKTKKKVHIQLEQ